MDLSSILLGAIAATLVITLVTRGRRSKPTNDRQDGTTLDPSDEAKYIEAMKEQLEARFLRAEQLTHEYAAVLQSEDQGSLNPLSMLPASVEVMKSSLLIHLLSCKMRGQLTPDLIANFKVSYGLLSTFVPDADLPPGESQASVMRNWPNLPRTPEDIRAHAKQLSAALPSAELQERSILRMLEYYADFDARWTSMQESGADERSGT